MRGQYYGWIGWKPGPAACMRRERPGGPEHELDMERPPTSDDARTAALDERPTPRRNRRPRFASAHSAATIPEYEAPPPRHQLDDATAALPRSYDPDERHPPRQVVLGRYRLERRIGAGGFGVVWLAFDEKLEREVAVKVVPRDGAAADEPHSQRAEREARVAARLNHPGIVALYELGADDEAVYLVSELVPGRTL